MIVIPNRRAARGHLSPPFQLSEQKRRQDIGRKITGTKPNPSVLIHLATVVPAPISALFPQYLGLLHEALVVEDQSSAFAADQVLRFVEALGRQRAEGS